MLHLQKLILSCLYSPFFPLSGTQERDFLLNLFSNTVFFYLKCARINVVMEESRGIPKSVLIFSGQFRSGGGSYHTSIDSLPHALRRGNNIDPLAVLGPARGGKSPT